MAAFLDQSPTRIFGEFVPLVNFIQEWKPVLHDTDHFHIAEGSSFQSFVYRFDISLPVQLTGTDDAVPATFTLQQNYPNPFNGETRLAFDTEVSQYLALKIYNILGQEVTTLAEGIFSPGTYYAYWNGADYNGMMQSSGVYFAKLQADNASQIIKLIFLK